MPRALGDVPQAARLAATPTTAAPRPLLALVAAASLSLLSRVAHAQRAENVSFSWYRQGLFTATCSGSSTAAYSDEGVLPLRIVQLQQRRQAPAMLLSLGYGAPCPVSTSLEYWVDRRCSLQLYGDVLASRDDGLTWSCVGVEPRVARFHAASVTIDARDDPANDCTSVCVLGGQRPAPLAGSDAAAATTSVVCSADGKVWVEADPLPFPVVGGAAVYADGSVWVVGGVRGGAAWNTSTLLEADVEPRTCLPRDWRQAGRSPASRFGDLSTILDPSVSPLVNRTHLWAAAVPPSAALPPGTPPPPWPAAHAALPALLAGGGLTLPPDYAFTSPDTYSMLDVFSLPRAGDVLYTPLAPVGGGDVAARALLAAGSGSLHAPVSIPLPPLPTSTRHLQLRVLHLPSLPEAGSTLQFYGQPVRFTLVFLRAHFTSVSADWGATWINVGHRSFDLDTPGDDGLLLPGSLPAAPAASLFDGVLGADARGDMLAVGMERAYTTLWRGFARACMQVCLPGQGVYRVRLCKLSPYEGECAACSVCNPLALSSTYTFAACEAARDAVCAPCTACAATPLRACNATADAVCDAAADAAVRARSRRVPVRAEVNAGYVLGVTALAAAWVIACGAHGTGVAWRARRLDGDSAASARTASSGYVAGNGFLSRAVRHSGLAMLRTVSVALGALSGVTFAAFDAEMLALGGARTARALALSPGDQLQATVAGWTGVALFIGAAALTAAAAVVVGAWSSLLAFPCATATAASGDGQVRRAARVASAGASLLAALAAGTASLLHHRLAVALLVGDRESLGLLVSLVRGQAVAAPPPSSAGTASGHAHKGARPSPSHASRLRALLRTLLLCSASIVVDMGHVVLLVVVSDGFGATASALQPLTAGVATCALVNVAALMARLYDAARERQAILTRSAGEDGVVAVGGGESFGGCEGAVPGPFCSTQAAVSPRTLHKDSTVPIAMGVHGGAARVSASTGSTFATRSGMPQPAPAAPALATLERRAGMHAGFAALPSGACAFPHTADFSGSAAASDFARPLALPLESVALGAGAGVARYAHAQGQNRTPAPRNGPLERYQRVMAQLTRPGTVAGPDVSACGLGVGSAGEDGVDSPVRALAPFLAPPFYITHEQMQPVEAFDGDPGALVPPFGTHDGGGCAKRSRGAALALATGATPRFAVEDAVCSSGGSNSGGGSDGGSGSEFA